MESILESLNTYNSFDDMSMHIQKKDTITLVENFFKNLEITANPREFLALWMIYKFPHDILGTKYNIKFYQQCNNIFTSSVNLKSDIVTAIQAFKKWKKKDTKILKNEMFHQYHNLGIVLLNATEENKAAIITCRVSILKHAKKIGGNKFVEKIKQYKPLVFNLFDLEKMSEKAFWDHVQENYTQKNYDWIYIILEHILNLFKIISPKNTAYYEDIIDISFIKQQVENNVYTDVQNLAYKLIEIVKSLHAAIHDTEIDYLKNQQFDLINLLREIVNRSEHIVHMIMQLKN